MQPGLTRIVNGQDITAVIQTFTLIDLNECNGDLSPAMACRLSREG